MFLSGTVPQLAGATWVVDRRRPAPHWDSITLEFPDHRDRAKADLYRPQQRHLPWHEGTDFQDRVMSATALKDDASQRDATMQ